MSEFNAETLITILALVGIVILIATLLSGPIDRSGFPQVAVFLIIGAVLGPLGLNLIHVTLDTPILRIVATLSLVLVLFTDAISLNISEIRHSSTLTLLILGPGTLLSAFLIAFAAWLLLGLPPAAAVLLGAALASTDPVLLRGLLRRDDIPRKAKQALHLESGLNDVVLLPIVLVAMTFLDQTAEASASTWARLALDLLVLGPGAGVLVGVCAVATLTIIRKKISVRRDYESLFSLGVAFTAYAAAEAVHGSGFLAAFAAGLTISAMDVELCDCFLEYGETTAELTLLFTFVLFGASLIWSGLAILSLPVLLFAVIALLIRPISILLSLAGVQLSRYERLLIAWFGPRGLSSLLLILLPVFAGIAGSQTWFAICALVVLLSVIVHGGSPFVLTRLRGRNSRRADLTTRTASQPAISHISVAAQVAPTSATPPRTETTIDASRQAGQTGAKTPAKPVVPTIKEPHRVPPLRISLAEMQSLRERGEPLVLLDVRSQRTYDSSDQQAQGAMRLDPTRATFLAEQRVLPRDAWLICYCA